MLRSYQAFLFDMDGTLLTSRAAIERVWTLWSAKWGLDPAEVSDFLHGRRATDAVDHFLPHLEPTHRAAEVDWVETREMEDTNDVHEVPGAAAFLAALPAGRWAIVTSAARSLALCRIKAAGLPSPAMLIAAEDVAIGKPDPSGYLRAAALMGKPIADCLVFEDAPAGIRAGLAAGADVLMIGNDKGSRGFPAKAHVSDFTDLMCAHARDGTLQIVKRLPAGG